MPTPVRAAYRYLEDFDNDGVFVHAQVGGPARFLGTQQGEAYENVTADVRNVPPAEIKYGRNLVREYGPPVAGSAKFTLDNSDGRYSSRNPSSPLYGLLNPGIRCAVEAELGGVTYRIHDGYRDAPVQRPGPTTQLVAETSYDGITKYLATTTVSTGMLVGVTVDLAIAAVLDAAGWPAGLRALATAKTTLARWWVDGVTALEAIRDLVFTEGPGALFYVDPRTGAATFEDRHTRLEQTRATTSQVTLRNSGAEPVYGQNLQFDEGLTGIVNSCTVPVNSYATAALAPIWTGPASVALAPGEVASYPVTTTADGFTGALAPVAGTDYVLTAGSLASATLSRTSGRRATLALTAGGGGATLTGLQVRAQAVAISRTYVSNTVSGASASGVDYGVKTYPDEFLPSWLPDANTAQDYANYVVGRYKDPVARVYVALDNGDVARLTQALTRRISDRITVVEDARAFINADFMVETVQHLLTDGGNHQAILGCEAAANAAFWSLGVPGFSELGVTTRLCY